MGHCFGKAENCIWDPVFFLDEDERLYLYWGCSNENPLYGVEMDYKNNFVFLGQFPIWILISTVGFRLSF
jgi:hypothetical protein